MQLLYGIIYNMPMRPMQRIGRICIRKIIWRELCLVRYLLSSDRLSFYSNDINICDKLKLILSRQKRKNWFTCTWGVYTFESNYLTQNRNNANLQLSVNLRVAKNWPSGACLVRSMRKYDKIDLHCLVLFVIYLQTLHKIEKRPFYRWSVLQINQ